MNDTDSLELLIKSKGDESLKVLKDLVSTMTQLNTTLTKVNQSTSAIENVGKASQKAYSKIDKLGSSFSKIFSFVGAKRIGLKMMDFLGSATDRAEELNLFNVIFKNVEKDGVKTFSTLGKEAIRFQNRLNEAFGTNMTETLRFQGLFQAMAQNAGIDEKKAAIMSENMTKLTYDLASLYNTSEKSTAEALRAGVYAGQTKPLRKFGIDVTQTSFKPLMAELGIEKSVNELSQGEKQILRYVAALRQASSAMGDFADTIESPANQLKVFKQQLVEVKTAWGNLFMGMYSQILPYANAILMVIKEIAKAIASIMNLSTRDFNTGLASQEDIYEDISTGAGKASKATKELKRQILGFDQINNLTTPSNTGSGAGGGTAVGGIDKRLLDALSGYDNLMDKVKMKATEIRDRWMEILGFKKEINPLTGEVEFKYQGLGTTITNIWKAFSKLNPQTKLFAGILTGIGIAKLVTGFKKLFTVLGGSGLLKSVSNLLSPLKSMFDYTKLYWSLIGKTETGTKKLSSALGEGIDAWHRSATGAEKLATGLKGIGMNVGGLALLKTGLKDIAENGVNFLNVAEGISGAFSTIFGGVTTGAAVGGTTGAIVGGIVGGIEVLIGTITGLRDILDEDRREFNKLKEDIDNGYEDWQKSVENLNSAYDNTDSTFDYYTRLADELDNIVDKNGKIKQGYEDRAKVIITKLNEAFGTEYKIVDGVIQKYGDLQKEIANLIKQKRVMAKLNSLEQAYNEALDKHDAAYDNKIAAYDRMNEAHKKLNKALEGQAEKLGLTVQELSDYTLYGKKSAAIQDILNTGYNDQTELLKEIRLGYKNQKQEISETTELYNKASDELDGYNYTIATYDKMYGYVMEKNYAKADEYFQHLRHLYGKDTHEQEVYWNDIVSKNETGLKMLEEDRGKYTEAQYKALKKEHEDELELAKDALAKIQLVYKTKSGEITSETVEAWKNMGNKSTEEFLLYFEQLPDDAKKKLVDGMEKNKKGLSKDLQKVINEIKPTLTVDVKGNVAPITQSIKAVVKKFAPFISDETVNSILRKYNLAAGGGVYNGSNWSKLPQFANGGLPNHGTLFAAGENGAEIVGNINRRTEVLNRSQIASAIYTAVSDAMRTANIGGEVHLYAHTDEGVVIDRINQKTKQTGVCPINIPS